MSTRADNVPGPGKAARIYAAAMATLDDGGPAFGVRNVQREAPSGLERTRAAYADPSAYPLPNPRNWLSKLANVDLKDVPGIAGNTLSGMARAAWQDPVSALTPYPKGAQAAIKAAKVARTVRMNETAGRAFKAIETGKRVEQTQKALTMYEQAERFRAHASSFPAGTKVRKALVRTSREWADASETAMKQAGDTRNIPYKFTRTGPRSAEVPEVPQLARRKSDVVPGQSRDFRGSAKQPASVSQPMSGTTRVRRNTGEAFSPKAREHIEYARKNGMYTPRPDLLRGVKELDARKAPDSDYRSLLSTGGKEKGGFKNWREKALVFGGYE